MNDNTNKFHLLWKKENPPIKLEELNHWRNEVYSLGLIGKYDNGVSFGSISIREGDGFVITGSETSGIEMLTEEHYTKVTDWDFAKNGLTCKGPIPASSESLSHAAIYESDKTVNAIIYVCNLRLWERLMNKFPTTSEKVEHGTPEMAYEIIRLFKETNVKEKKILVMAGYKEGLISFGGNLDKAGKTLLSYFNRK